MPKCEISEVNEGRGFIWRFCSTHDMPALKDAERCPLGQIEDATEAALAAIDEAARDAKATQPF